MARAQLRHFWRPRHICAGPPKHDHHPDVMRRVCRRFHRTRCPFICCVMDTVCVTVVVRLSACLGLSLSMVVLTCWFFSLYHCSSVPSQRMNCMHRTARNTQILPCTAHIKLQISTRLSQTNRRNMQHSRARRSGNHTMIRNVRASNGSLTSVRDHDPSVCSPLCVSELGVDPLSWAMASDGSQQFEFFVWSCSTTRRC